MSISSDLQFHLQGIETPDVAWKKLETVFGKHNEIQAHQLENQLIALNPSDFSCIEDFLSKFKTLRLLLAECKIKRKMTNLYMLFLLSLAMPILFLYLLFTPLEKHLLVKGLLTKCPLLKLFVIL
jgi:hypothetical protein